MRNSEHNTATTADSKTNSRTLARRVRNYIQAHPTASVPEILGRFLLDPDEYADLVGAQLNTARVSNDAAGGVEA
jgi:hypothetical protein